MFNLHAAINPYSCRLPGGGSFVPRLTISPVKNTCSESSRKRGYFESSLLADQFDAFLFNLLERNIIRIE